MTVDALKKYNVVIADADIKIGKVLQQLLFTMGFAQTHLTDSGEEAIELMRSASADFLITEQELKHTGGLELLENIRRRAKFADVTVPVIMISGRAENTDVLRARDYGVNEYLLKPFTAQNLYSRIERLFEAPRNFVVTQQFIGPDRRTKPSNDNNDRRLLKLQPTEKPSQQNKMENITPKLWNADFSLQKRLGAGTHLSSIVTPEVINKAQETIYSNRDESMTWIREALDKLKSLYSVMQVGKNIYTLLPVEISETALMLSTRAGTFSYVSASNIAYSLSKFSRYQLRPEYKPHQIITLKHIETLEAALQDGWRNQRLNENKVIMNELQKLIDKYGD